MGIIIAALAVLAAYYIRHATQKRRGEAASFARTHGFEFSEQDHVGIFDRDVALFRKGHSRWGANVVSGEWKQMSFFAYDYTFVEGSGRQPKIRRYSVALTDLAANLPSIQITSEDVITSIADRLGLHDFQFESGEFNARFQVTSRDRKAAYELIDPSMMNWLLSVAGRFSFETGGRTLLCYCQRLDLMPQVIDYLKEFRDKIPRLVMQKYRAEPLGGPEAYPQVPSPATTPAPPPATQAPPPPPPAPPRTT